MINEGIARYRFPEKETIIFKSFQDLLSDKRYFKVKFLFVSLKTMAKNTVNILEIVASVILVKKDFINNGSVTILLKSAPIPSTTMAIKGNIKNTANRLIITICNRLICLGSDQGMMSEVVFILPMLVLKFDENSTSKLVTPSWISASFNAMAMSKSSFTAS